MSKPNFFERFQAGFKAATNSDLPTKEGAIDFNEDAIAGFEASVQELKDLRTANATLIEAAGTHAQAVSDLEASVATEKANVTAEAAKLAPIAAALEVNNIEVAEGSDAVTAAVETINTWGKGTGKPAGAQATSGDDLGDEDKTKFHSSVDDEVTAARAALGLNK